MTLLSKDYTSNLRFIVSRSTSRTLSQFLFHGKLNNAFFSEEDAIFLIQKKIVETLQTLLTIIFYGKSLRYSSIPPLVSAFLNWSRIWTDLNWISYYECLHRYCMHMKQTKLKTIFKQFDVKIQHTFKTQNLRNFALFC